MAGAILVQGRRHLGLGPNESNWQRLGRLGRFTCPHGVGHVTTEPEVARPAPSWFGTSAVVIEGLTSLIVSTWAATGGSRASPSPPPVGHVYVCPPGVGHVSAKPEEPRLAASWFGASAFLVWGPESNWQHLGRVEVGHVPPRGRSCDCQTGSATAGAILIWGPNEPNCQHMGSPRVGHMTAEPEVPQPAPSWFRE